MKPLLKSLREANRYILLKLSTDSSTSSQSISHLAVFLTIVQKLKETYSVLDLAEFDLQYVENLSKFPYFVLVTNARGSEVLCPLLNGISAIVHSDVRSINMHFSVLLRGGTLKRIKYSLSSGKL